MIIIINNNTKLVQMKLVIGRWEHVGVKLRRGSEML
jgi:hypothetical protein